MDVYVQQTYVNMSLTVYICIYTYLDVCICTPVCTYLYTCSYKCTHTYVHKYIYVYVCYMGRNILELKTFFTYNLMFVS